MSGLKSRSKGKREEYALRDAFREAGYLADRVPSSGAAQGFKGDIKLEVPGLPGTFLVELKARKSAFARLYKALEKYGPTYIDVMYKEEDGRLTAASISTNVRHTPILLKRQKLGNAHYLEDYSDLQNVVSQLQTVRKWKAICDLLVLKANNKPYLFIQYRTQIDSRDMSIPLPA